MENEIKEVIETLADVFQKESDAKHTDWVKNAIQEYSHLDIKKPEMFSLLVSLTSKRQIGLLARVALTDVKATKEKKYQLEFAYTSYDFIVRHLKKIIVKYEGGACSTDKTRWLMDSYVDCLVTGNVPSMDGEKKYWHVKAGEMIDWINWIGSMADLYYGNEETYVVTKQALIQAYDAQISENLSMLHQTFTTHESFTKVETINNEEEYTFVDKTTQDQGTIVINDVSQISYRFYFEREKRNAKYGDNIPEWFELLLKTKKPN